LESKESIIIIDDDESTCKTLALIFNKKGYDVETVGTGHEAMEKLSKRSFNLAFLDIKLPDIEGVELLKPMKTMYPFMDIMMITGHATIKTAIYALNNGASSYITKPLDIDEILDKINDLLEKQKYIQQIKKKNFVTKKENILIVDDDESTCKMLAFILNKKGYNVETVGTGYEALEIAQHKNFNLALLDIKLPDIEGIELLVPLKKLYPDMETMMMTAYSSLESVVRALNEGALAYIIKPLDMDDVLHKINNTFEKQRLIVEKEKLEQDLRYQGVLIENISDAIISSDKNHNIKFWNKAAEIMYGWALNEVIGKPLAEIIHSKYPYAQRKDVRKQLYERGYWNGELIQKTKEGKLLNILSSSTLIKDKSGKIQGVVSINRDITERKKAEKELQLQRDNLINILSSMEDGVYIVDQNYDIEYLNPIFIKEFGQYEGKKYYKYFYDRDEMCLWCKNPEVFKGNSVRWEFCSIRNQRTYDNIDTPLKNIDGSTSKLTISRDITKFKKVEQDLLSTLENLKRANIELERFAYVASHDLQEPLRMIVSFIQLFEKRYKDKLDEDADDFINFIVDGAKRMQSLINDLLSYSQIGRSDKPFKLFDTNVVINSVIDNLKKSIEETNAKITYDPLPTLIGNEAEFIQLLQNLISNAIKFHKEEEPPVVHISAKLQKKQWIFSVRDNGIGIDSQFFDRIFIIFQRLHKKDEFGGTGIGLAICKKIIEHHNGKIWVESEVGKGSTFYFSIPKTEVRK